MFKKTLICMTLILIVGVTATLAEGNENEKASDSECKSWFCLDFEFEGGPRIKGRIEGGNKKSDGPQDERADPTPEATPEETPEPDANPTPEPDAGFGPNPPDANPAGGGGTDPFNKGSGRDRMEDRLGSG